MKKINIIQLDPDEFKNELLQEIKVQFEEISERNLSRNSDKLLTRKETAEYLKINLSTLHFWTLKGKIPKESLGNRIYYRKSEIDKALKN